MPIRVAIDGFDGQSRQFLAAVLAGGFSDLYEVVAINEPAGIEAVANRMKLDSTYGRYRGTIAVEADRLQINERPIAVLAESDRSKLDWTSADADIVVVASVAGDRSSNGQDVLERGAKKVVIVGQGAEDDLTLMVGVNDGVYDPDIHSVVATGSAAANALAPLLTVLDAAYSASRSVYAVVHPVHGNQSMVDQPGEPGRISRTAWKNIVPWASELNSEMTRLLPRLDGKTAGSVVTAPVSPVGWLSLTIDTERRLNDEAAAATVSEAAASDAYFGVIGCTDEPGVSADYAGDARSVVVDLTSVTTIGRNMVALCGWFDAEWALACRTADLVALICEAGVPGTA